MRVIDTHCDALLKLEEANGTLSFKNSPELDVNLEKLQKGKVKVQAFAIFTYPSLNTERQWESIMNQVYYFYYSVLPSSPKLVHIRDWSQLDTLKDDEIGAMLTLEGVGGIGNDLKRLAILKQLGIMMLGLTWNDANLAADGILEPRNGGLTTLGKKIVAFNNKHHMITDVSHLSERGFWDVIEQADYMIASHSNSRTICPHVRNLTDEQIEAMIKKDALIHLVYCPAFVAEKEQVTIDDLLKHIDHIASLGGMSHIGLGSDFDGIGRKVERLEDASMTVHLVEALLQHYSEDEVKGITSENFLRCIPRT